ncbi:MAG TPA: peptide ABC transporter substrate-binding protein [Streptosporangiaceae bacterium]|nr:peptide ABC transporter substrate-binding protein [Streptosporangiaceae bacterium]
MSLRPGLTCRLGVLAVVAGLAIAACSSSPTTSSSSSGGSSGGGTVHGGTVTMAYPPGTEPVDIFPMFPASDDTTQEIFWFVEQMWRPLYWFGDTSGGLTFNSALSLANPPVFSNGNKTVTITMKHWKWSDGQPITTRDVEFWMNLLMANKADYANYVPGYFPDNIASIKYSSATTFSITFKQAYSQNWLLLNQLCLIFPMPQHVWDKTSATGKVGNYDETPAGAKAVFNYLTSAASKLSTYNTNPLWQVVDGPFHLKSYDANSQVTLAANPRYSGPDKPKISAVQFLSFTSDAAEYNQLLSGNIDYGYVPFSDLASQSRVTSLGYSIVPWAQAAMNYASFNYTNPTTGPLFSQLYIRQALQHLTDQKGMITAALHGAGVPTYGAVPAYQPQPTANGVPLADPAANADASPFSVSAAISLLKAHGWNVTPGGTDTCAKPGTGSGDCGAGIKAGQQLAFKFTYPTGVSQDAIEVQLLASDAKKAGVSIAQQPVPDSVTFSNTVCQKGKPCNWDIDYYYLGGWQYGVPINYPVGNVIFGCGGPYIGGYCSHTLDNLMTAAETSDNISALYAYEKFLNANNPVWWLPLQPYQFSAIKTNLHGATPQNVGYWITPEFWSLSS